MIRRCRTHKSVGRKLLERLRYPDGFLGEMPPDITASVWVELLDNVDCRR